MADNIQKVIQKYFDRIENELNARAISGKLFSKEVIGFNQKQEITSKDTHNDANVVLANYLHQNADRAKLECFLTVLESDETRPKHKLLAKAMRESLAQLSVGSCTNSSYRDYVTGDYQLHVYTTYFLCMQCKGRGSSEHAQQPSQQDRGFPAQLSSPRRESVNSEFNEQPSYSLRPAENRDLHMAEQPESLEEQDDRPWVDPECMDLDSSENVELPCIDDEVVPEEDLDDDEASLAEQSSPEQPENAAKKKSEFFHCN